VRRPESGHRGGHSAGRRRLGSGYDLGSLEYSQLQRELLLFRSWHWRTPKGRAHEIWGLQRWLARPGRPTTIYRPGGPTAKCASHHRSIGGPKQPFACRASGAACHTDQRFAFELTCRPPCSKARPQTRINNSVVSEAAGSHIPAGIRNPADTHSQGGVVGVAPASSQRQSPHQWLRQSPHQERRHGLRRPHHRSQPRPRHPADRRQPPVARGRTGWCSSSELRSFPRWLR
jgi:hypothetical protein